MPDPDFTPLQVQHPAQPYVARSAQLARSALAQQVPVLLGQVYDWLRTQGEAVTGAALIRYRQVDPASGLLHVDVGFPVADALADTPEPWIRDVLPAGCYLTLVHRGAYDGLAASTARLLDWGQRHHVPWAQGATPQHWLGRVEHYLVGPPGEPRSAHWHTEIAILRANAP